MDKTDSKYPFTLEDWETCLRVLSQLKDNPLNNPDNQHFKSLISKIKKNSRKEIRKTSYSEKKSGDLAVQKESVIVENALEGKSTYSEEQAAIPAQGRYQKLSIPKNCYCCNDSFSKAHFFYNRICPTCAERNYEKRFREESLTGQVAILTGCRVKVGFATALKLLRAGAFLIGTTRFPASALEQFQKEEDFGSWKGRLVLYGLDLRDLKQIESFVAYVKSTVDHLHILVNNAAQTIKYPDDYYLPIIAHEQKLLPQANPDQLAPNATPVVSSVALMASADVPDLESLELTRFGQPVDERDKTSWNSKLEEVSLVELLEVNLINQIAPYHLIKELKPLMLKTELKSRHIINVTSSEGIFSYANKTVFHPHTNMTKASLNMLTRTSASDFAKDHIYMNSVDVGWVSTGAKEVLRKKQFDKAYVPPLDSVDAASRIMDPIYEGLNGEFVVGELLKNYEVHEW